MAVPWRRFVLFAMVSALAVPGVGAAESSAAVVFASRRCADAADLAERPHFFNGFGHEQECMPAIWRVEDDGSNLHRLAGSGEGGWADGEPDVSRDGSLVVLQRGQPLGVDTNGPSSPNQIYVMPATGGPAVKISPPRESQYAAYDQDPSLSPDGLSVAFVRATGAGLKWDIWSTDIAGANARRLTSAAADEQSPVFSPDGAKIAFAAPGGYVNESLGAQLGIYVMNPDGSDVAPLLAGSVPVAPTGIDWSPDGSALIATIGGALTIVPLDGRPPTNLRVPGLAPSFGASADTVFFDPGGGTINRLDIASGSGPKQLIAGPATAPKWIGPRPGLPLLPDVTAPVILAGSELNPPAPGVRARVAAVAPGRPQVTTKAGTTSLPVLAVDRSGVRSLQASVAQRVGKRCRFVAPPAWSAPRACGTPRWIAITDARAWSTGLASLPKGRYLIGLRAADTAGNTSRRPRYIELGIR